jgi:hypothetical protein
MKKIITLAFVLSTGFTFSQELYVYSDPASNVPANSLSFKYGGKWVREENLGHVHTTTRQMIETSLGINKKLMLRPSLTLGNMYAIFPDQKLKFESASIYLKYRLLSIDDVHKHFRASVYAKGIYSANSLLYDELTMDGDQTAIQFGFIATKLVKKFALSATLSMNQILDEERFNKYGGPRNFGYQAFNYSLSSGYLLFPRKYSSYDQTNLNLYLEMIGGKGLDLNRYKFIDLAPALQLIFKSTSKLNIGYRFQINGNAYRMARSSAYLSFEKTLLNKIGKRK